MSDIGTDPEIPVWAKAEFVHRIATLEADLKQSRERAERLVVAGDAMKEALRDDRCYEVYGYGKPEVAKWIEAKGNK